MGSHRDQGDAQVRPRRLLVLFLSPCQFVVTAILVKAQLRSSRGCLLLGSIGFRPGSSGSVAGVPRRQEAEQQGNNRDDRAEFHDCPVCLSALCQNGPPVRLPVRIVAAISAMTGGSTSDPNGGATYLGRLDSRTAARLITKDAHLKRLQS